MRDSLCCFGGGNLPHSSNCLALNTQRHRDLRCRCVLSETSEISEFSENSEYRLSRSEAGAAVEAVSADLALGQPDSLYECLEGVEAQRGQPE